MSRGSSEAVSRFGGFFSRDLSSYISQFSSIFPFIVLLIPHHGFNLFDCYLYTVAVSVLKMKVWRDASCSCEQQWQGASGGVVMVRSDQGGVWSGPAEHVPSSSSNTPLLLHLS